MRASALCEACCQYAGCPNAIPNHPLAAFGVRHCKRDDGQSLGRLLVLPGGCYADYTPGLVEWQDKQRQSWKQEDSARTTDPATGQPIIRPELAAQHL